MIETAYLSGQLGKALYREKGDLYMIGMFSAEEPVLCHPGDVSLFFNADTEIDILTGPQLTVPNLRELLYATTNAYVALTLSISGLNRKLSDKTRKNSIGVSEDLLSNPEVRTFVRGRFLARPLPEGADCEKAIVLAAEAQAHRLKALYEQVVKAQSAIGIVLDAWKEIAGKMKSDEDGIAAERLLIDNGVFADIVDVLASGKHGSISFVIFNYNKHPKLQEKLPQYRQTITSLQNEVIKLWKKAVESEVTAEKKAKTEKPEAFDDSKVLIDQKGADRKEAVQTEAPYSDIDDRIRGLITGFTKNKKKSHKRLNALEAKKKVDKQIESIGSLIQNDELSKAFNFLYDLIEFNLTHGQEKHVAMTLCSLAQKALDANKCEVAEKLLAYAKLLAIEDAVVLNMDAFLQKKRHQFAQALALYDKAINRFPDNVIARTGKAEVLKALGQLHDSLTLYDETISLFPDNVVARTGKAEVLKARGQLHDSLTLYDETISLFPDNVIARNGKAEVLKTLGQLHNSLTLYDETISLFPDNVVARNGRTHTLIAMGQYSEAEKSLFHGTPLTHDEWVAYHISAMYHLKTGDEQEAVRRLEYGVEHAPPLNKIFFQTALAFVKITVKDYPGAECYLHCKKDDFSDNVLDFKSFYDQKCLLFLGHSQAGQNKRDDAIATLHALSNSEFPRILVIKDYLTRRYNLSQEGGLSLSIEEQESLDIKIIEEEALLLAA